MYECEDKMVSHPDHYQSGNGMEVIDVIKAFTADLKGIQATDTGNAIKYILRWPKKEKPIQDLKKAIWYIQHLIDQLEGKEETIDDVKKKLFNNIAIIDAEGNIQQSFSEDWYSYVCDENERTFTVRWIGPLTKEPCSRTFCKVGFTYKFIEEGE